MYQNYPLALTCWVQGRRYLRLRSRENACYSNWHRRMGPVHFFWWGGGGAHFWPKSPLSLKILWGRLVHFLLPMRAKLYILLSQYWGRQSCQLVCFCRILYVFLKENTAVRFFLQKYVFFLFRFFFIFFFIYLFFLFFLNFLYWFWNLHALFMLWKHGQSFWIIMFKNKAKIAPEST